MTREEMHKLLTEAVMAWREATRHADELDDAICALLRGCPDPECATCAQIVCHYGNPLHFRYDGCPSCVAESKTHHAPETIQ